jgi:hypothetical protein
VVLKLGRFRIGQKYLQSFKIWLEKKISWADHVKNEEVLHTVKEEEGILRRIKQRNVNWIRHILCRNCLLKHNIEGKTEVMRIHGRRCKQLLDELKEIRRYWNLKEEAPDRSLWRTHFGKGYGPVIR